jgi:hypothetical protein
LSGLLFGANKQSHDEYYFGVVDLETGVEFHIPIPVRCHDAVLHPTQPLVALAARRPGRELYVFDLEKQSLAATIPSSTERHFYGHAVFDPKGAYLFATENVFDDTKQPDLTPQESVIGVYDVKNGFERIREFSTRGVGAHQLSLLSDGRTLVVANGGIYTHPEYGRQKLNIDTMDPSLAFIDSQNGKLQKQHRLDDHQLSIRHLAIGPNDEVIAGLQYEGPAQAEVPLVIAKRADHLQPFAPPRSSVQLLANYIGSVAIHPESGRIAATSPRGGHVAFFEPDGSYLGALNFLDVSGAVAVSGYFALSTGTGRIHLVDADTLETIHTVTSETVRWDNHISSLA